MYDGLCSLSAIRAMGRVAWLYTRIIMCEGPGLEEPCTCGGRALWETSTCGRKAVHFVGPHGREVVHAEGQAQVSMGHECNA